jgi:hypothetical protein
VIRHDDGRTAGRNALPIAVIDLELNGQGVQQTLGETDSRSGAECARLKPSITSHGTSSRHRAGSSGWTQ